MHLPPFLGLQKTSLVDYPGLVAPVVFFPGCNLKCPYCHNADLAHGRTEGLLARDEVIEFVKNRAPLMGGVVLSGGEPLLYSGLSDFILQIRNETKLKIKLDTKGNRYDELALLLESFPPDFIAMDIKSDRKQIARLGMSSRQYELVKKSAELIISSGIKHQFRSTVHPLFINKHSVVEISGIIKGCDDYILNPFHPGNCLDESFDEDQETSSEMMRDLKESFVKQGLPCHIPST